MFLQILLGKLLTKWPRSQRLLRRYFEVCVWPMAITNQEDFESYHQPGEISKLLAIVDYNCHVSLVYKSGTLPQEQTFQDVEKEIENVIKQKSAEPLVKTNTALSCMD